MQKEKEIWIKITKPTSISTVLTTTRAYPHLGFFEEKSWGKLKFNFNQKKLFLKSKLAGKIAIHIPCTIHTRYTQDSTIQAFDSETLWRHLPRNELFSKWAFASFIYFHYFIIFASFSLFTWFPGKWGREMFHSIRYLNTFNEKRA